MWIGKKLNVREVLSEKSCNLNYDVTNQKFHSNNRKITFREAKITGTGRAESYS